jgi:predicted Rossmann fold nucleotide-binding protein DprA/Smf involved in DNA uptake
MQSTQCSHERYPEKVSRFKTAFHVQVSRFISACGGSSPPKELFVAGELDELLARPRVAIVGSRKVSAYGRSVTTQLASELASREL